MPQASSRTAIHEQSILPVSPSAAVPRIARPDNFTRDRNDPAPRKRGSRRCRPEAALSIGTISRFQTAAIGSGRRRPRATCRHWAHHRRPSDRRLWHADQERASGEPPLHVDGESRQLPRARPPVSRTPAASGVGASFRGRGGRSHDAAAPSAQVMDQGAEVYPDMGCSSRRGGSAPPRWMHRRRPQLRIVPESHTTGPMTRNGRDGPDRTTWGA